MATRAKRATEAASRLLTHHQHEARQMEYWLARLRRE